MMRLPQIPALHSVFSLLLFGLTMASAEEPKQAEQPVAGEPVEVVNGDFEQDLFNWEGKAVLDQEVRHGGAKSLRLEKGHVYQPPAKKLLIWIQPGFDYRLSVWIRTEGCQEKGVTVAADIWAGSNEDTIKGTGWIPGDHPAYVHDGGASPALIATGGTHDWKKFSAGIPADQLPDAPTQALFIYLRHDAAAQPTGQAWFDDLQVEKLPKGTIPNPDDGLMLRNGGFEESRRSWAGPAIEIVPDAGVNDSAALKIVDGYAYQNKIKVEGKQKYRVSMKVRTNETPEGMVLVQTSYRGPGIKPDWRGSVQSDAGNHAEAALFTTGGTHPWKEFSVVVEAPARASEMLLYLRKRGGDGEAFFDDVRIEPTTDAVTTVAELRAAGMAPATPMLDDTDFARTELGNTDFAQGKKDWILKGVGQVVPTTDDGQALELIHGEAMQGLKIDDKKNYRIQVRTKTEAARDEGASVKLVFRSGNLDKVGTEEVLLTGGTHDWQELSTVVKPPARAREMLVYLSKDLDDGTAWFDNLKITPTEDAVVSPEEAEKARLAKLLPAAPAESDPAAALAALVTAARQETPKQITLAKEGAAQYRIHVGSGDNATVLHAAEALADYLGRMSGGDFLPLSHDAHPASGPMIIVGRENALTEKIAGEVDWKALGEGGFVLRSIGLDLLVAGATPAGTLNGVFYLLDRHFGVHWLSPEFTKIPSKKTLTLPHLDETQIPRFAYREIFNSDTDDPVYRARNLLNGSSHHRTNRRTADWLNGIWAAWPDDGHNFSRVVPIKNHADLWHGGQLAMMNPKMRELAAGYFLKRIERLEKKKQDYAKKLFGFSQEDHSWNPDKQSQKFAQTHGDSLAAPLVDMVAKVGAQVRQTYPEARFSTLAYQWSFKPPTKMQLPEYLVMVLAPIHANFAQPLDGPDNAEIARDIAGWNAISENNYIWDYITNFSSYIQPYPNYEAMYETIQYLATVPKITGYFAQGSMLSKGVPFAELRAWVAARLLWNPSLSGVDLQKEFVADYFGAAAPFIDQYLALMQKAVKDTHTRLGFRVQVTEPYLGFDTMRQADALFVQATEAVAGQPGFSRRVETARIGVDYVILLRRAEFVARAQAEGIDWKPETEMRLARLGEAVAHAGITKYGEGVGNVDALMQTLQIERTLPFPPQIVQGLDPKDWIDFQDTDIRLYSGKMVADPQASDHGAAQMPGNKNVWGIQLVLDRLPPGAKWNLYAVVRADPGEGKGPEKAMVLGVEPGKNRRLTVAEIAGSKYQTIEVPGGPFISDAGRALFFAPPKSKAVKAVLVDRVIAIRADAGKPQ